MTPRKPKNPKLAAAASNLAEAAQHVHRAVSQKVDEIGATVSAEIDKARQAALTKSGRAKRRFDAMLNKAETRLEKAARKARKSLQKAVRQSEGKLKAAKWAPDTRPSSLGSAKLPPVKAPAKKPPEEDLARSGRVATSKAVVKTVAKESAQGQRGGTP